MNKIPAKYQVHLDTIKASNPLPTGLQIVLALQAIWTEATGYNEIDRTPYFPQDHWIFDQHTWSKKMHYSRTRWPEKFWEEAAKKLILEGECLRKSGECTLPCPSHCGRCPLIKMEGE